MDDKKMCRDETPNQRRDVRFIKGVAAAGAARPPRRRLPCSAPTPLGSGTKPSAPGAAERLMTLKVNGLDRRVDVLKQETFAA